MEAVRGICRPRVERGEPMIQVFDLARPASRQPALASGARRMELRLCIVELPDPPLALGQEVRAAIVIRGRPVLPAVFLILRGVPVGLPIVIAIIAVLIAPISRCRPTVVAVLVAPISLSRLTVVAIFIAYQRRVIVAVGLVMRVPKPRRRGSAFV